MESLVLIPLLIVGGIVYIVCAGYSHSKSASDFEKTGVKPEHIFYSPFRCGGGLAISEADKKIVLCSRDTSYEFITINFDDIVKVATRSFGTTTTGEIAYSEIFFTVRNNEKASYIVTLKGVEGQECISRLELVLTCPKETLPPKQ